MCGTIVPNVVGVPLKRCCKPECRLRRRLQTGGGRVGTVHSWWLGKWTVRCNGRRA